MEIKYLNKWRVDDESQISEVRRQTGYAAGKLGFNEIAIGKISIVVTELCTNLIKHTNKQGGEILLQKFDYAGFEGLEIISIDKGPGMINVAESLRDGFSTAGSSGTGLGSISRMSDDFDIYSAPNVGSAISAKFWLKPSLKEKYDDLPFEISGICLPKKGEEVSGDAWSFSLYKEKIMILVSDGLGHGINANEASNEAIKAFKENKNKPVDLMLTNINNYLRKTRGAAVALTEINFENNTVKYCGIGNISGSIFSNGNSKSMISHNGIVGNELRKIQVFDYQWSSDSILVKHSDGMTSRWDLEKYPGLLIKSPSIISAVLYRDFCRGNDDFTVMVFKNKRIL